jgi:DNA polymerase-1
LLENPAIKKVGQNIKYEWIILKRYGIELREFTATHGRLLPLEPTKHNHNLGEIARDYLDRTVTDYKEVVGTGAKALRFDQVELDRARDYSCGDADVTLQLSHLLLPKIAEGGLQHLYEQVEIPLVTVLAKIEMNGVKMDANLLRDFSKEVEGQLQQKIERIYQLAGETFNINSSQQLGKILFEKLKLPVMKKTKTGYSTDVDVLTRLSLQHGLPLEILTYRNLTKLKSTYIDALPKLVHPETGRIHTSYNQTVTATGRLSSSDPNLQNIPIRTDEGSRIRQAFIPEKGWVIVRRLFSDRTENPCLCSQDEVLVRPFEKMKTFMPGRPVAFLAFLWTGHPAMRRGKVINFRISTDEFYGLSQQLGVEPKVAQPYR